MLCSLPDTMPNNPASGIVPFDMCVVCVKPNAMCCP